MVRHGFGRAIAAPQIGVDLRFIAMDPRRGPPLLINPEITDWQGFAVGREGCMSVPDFTGNVIRAKKIELSARDESGELQKNVDAAFA